MRYDAVDETGVVEGVYVRKLGNYRDALASKINEYIFFLRKRFCLLQLKSLTHQEIKPTA